MTSLHTAAANVLDRADVLPTVRRYLLQCEPADDEHARLLLGMAADIDWLIVAVQEMASTEPRGWLKRIGCADPLGALAKARARLVAMTDSEFLAALEEAGFTLLHTEEPPVSVNEPRGADVGDNLRESPIIWGDWDDSGPYLVLAEGRTVDEAAQVLDEMTCAPDSGYRAVPLDGPQPRKAMVYDCDTDQIGHCKDPRCRHGHEETVYAFELVEEDEAVFVHYWSLSPYTSPGGKMMYHCPRCGLYDPAPVKTQYERRPCGPDAYKDRFEVADGAVRIAGPKPLNPDTNAAMNADSRDCNPCPHRYAKHDYSQTLDDAACGMECKPHVWRAEGASNIRYAPELVKTVGNAMGEGQQP